MKWRTIGWRVAAILMAMGLLCTGCSGDGTGATTTTGESTTTTTTGAADTTTQTGGGTTSQTGGSTDEQKVTTTKKDTVTTTTTAAVNALSKSVVTWFESPLTDIFPDTVKSTSSLEKGHIDVAKNESESIQIGVRAGEEELTNLRVTVKPFSEKNAPAITVAPIRLVLNSKPSWGFTVDGGFVSKHSRGESPGEFPEYYDTGNNTVGLAKGIRYTVPAGQSAGIVVEVTTEANTPAGEYSTTVELSGDQGTRSIPITVKVWNTTLPEPKDSTFSYTNWFSSTNMNGDGFPAFMDAYYDAANFGENFFTVMANWAKVMAKQRQNVIYVPTMALLVSDMTIDADGTYHFTFKNFDRYIETFLENGSVKALEGGFFYEKDWYVNPPTEPNTWPEDSLVTAIFVKDGDRCTTKWVKVTDAAAEPHFDQLIPALYSHLKAKGWEDIWLQHVCDEPLSDLQADQISAMYKRILAEMPGVRTLDAGSQQLKNFPDGEMSVYCPQLDDYERTRNAYNQVNDGNSGHELWTYTCVNPQGSYMTRIADYPLLWARVIGWYDWQQGVTGYLHWGWNLWQQAKYSPNDPFGDMYCDSAAGDAFLVYPDAANMSVFEGPRSTSVRDSWEDYELLVLAAGKNSTKAKNLVDSIVTSGTVFTHVSEKLLDARLELLKLAAG